MASAGGQWLPEMKELAGGECDWQEGGDPPSAHRLGAGESPTQAVSAMFTLAQKAHTLAIGFQRAMQQEALSTLQQKTQNAAFH